MAKFELKLPKMGESVAEATITNWVKNIGDTIEQDETVVEVATDKVDSEVPSEVAGVLVEQLFQVDDVVQVGQTIAIIETQGGETTDTTTPAQATPEPEMVAAVEQMVTQAQETTASVQSTSERFYSPLVKSIAATEGISQQELDSIPGTGLEGRVTKNDLLQYLQNRTSPAVATPAQAEKSTGSSSQATAKPTTPISVNGQDEIIEMSRMGKIIAHHMIESIQTSAHVQ